MFHLWNGFTIETFHLWNTGRNGGRGAIPDRPQEFGGDWKPLGILLIEFMIAFYFAFRLPQSGAKSRAFRPSVRPPVCGGRFVVTNTPRVAYTGGCATGTYRDRGRTRHDS